MAGFHDTKSRKDRILARLAELNAGPKRSLGQNFLISDMVIDKILFAVKAEPFTEIIEVGPGLGALTEDLIAVVQEKQTRLTLVELDRGFVSEWGSRFEPLNAEAAAAGLPAASSAAAAGGQANYRVIEADALQLDWKTLELKPNTLFVSNLPYQISSSIAIERSIEPAGVSRMILMFQKEVAQRISARAKQPAYGLLTVIIQAFWETATVSEAGPKDFHPAPNVASRVLVFRRRPEPDFGKGNAEGFLKFAKAGFAHRRKLLARNLVSDFFRGAPGAQNIEAAFEKAGLLPTARAEELEPSKFIELYRLLAP
jgi:16S rRNA (adenine1518-N6/adenine1519-N6)-dimethyltransferase